MDRGSKIYVGAIATLLVGACAWEFNPWSRRTINPAGKTMQYKLPGHFEKMVNVSSGGSEGDVMMTYESVDGELKTKEYNRMGAFETDIEWVRPSD